MPHVIHGHAPSLCRAKAAWSYRVWNYRVGFNRVQDDNMVRIDRLKTDHRVKQYRVRFHRVKDNNMVGTNRLKTPHWVKKAAGTCMST